MKLPANQANSTTLQDLFNEFLSQCKIRNLSEATIQSYKNQFRLFTKHLSSETVLASITEDTVKEVIGKILNGGAKPISVNTMLRHMNAVLTMLILLE